METSDKLPIVDAHQHFWDLSRNYHPWLCDPEPIPFRYGDYSRLRRSYMPADYRRDSAGFDIVKTVYVEAEWDPKTPLAETRWVEAIAAEHGLPSAVVAQAWLDRDDAAEVLAGQAARPIVRGIRHKPAAAARRAGRPPRRRRLDGRSAMAARLRAPRTARAVLRPADAVVASRCRSGARARLPGDADHRQPRRPAVRPLARGPRRLAARSRGRRGVPERDAQDLRSRPRPACPGRSRRTAP